MPRKELMIQNAIGGYVVTDKKYEKRIFNDINDVATFVKTHFAKEK